MNMRGDPLMPCTQKKARILLKEGKAVIYKYDPFTIQLTYATGETKQDCHIGIDTGSKHIGMAITSENKVLFKGEIELRQDVKSNIDTKHIYRRSRRNRKTRYRQPRFLNRKRSDKWLPPSLQNRVDHTFHWIDTFCSLVSDPILHIEVGKFDTAKMINPEINGGTDRVDNLITVCTDCHTSKNHQKGGILYKWQEQHKKVKQYKEPPFMNAIRKRIFARYPNAHTTYGSETTPHRKELGLEKTHYNDAITISGITNIKEDPKEWLLIKQFRKKKRSLHEATARKGRKEPNCFQKRNSKNTPFYRGFYLNDKVKVFGHGQIGYITGFTSGGAYVKNVDGEYITIPNKSYKQVSIKYLKLLSHNNNWQYVVKSAV